MKPVTINEQTYIMKFLIHTLSIALFALILGGCAMQDNELGERQSSTVISGNEAQTQVESECDTEGVVRVTSGYLRCDYLIQLSDGSVVSPVNVEEIPFDLSNRLRIRFGYSVVREGDQGCLDAPYVHIKCIYTLDKEDQQFRPDDQGQNSH